MADAVLHDEAVKYPNYSALNNQPLLCTKHTLVHLGKMVSRFAVVAGRPTTSDPWDIEVTKIEDTEWNADFSDGPYDIDTGSMNWRSQADLNVKFHQRPTQKITIPFGSDGGSSRPFIVKDTSVDPGYRPANATEMAAHLWVEADMMGNAALWMKGEGDTFRICTRAEAMTQLQNIFAAILADTTHTAYANSTTGYLLSGNKADAECSVESVINVKKAAGTAGISVGNYGANKAYLIVRVPAAGGYPNLDITKAMEKDEAVALPGPMMDHIRKVTANNLQANIRVQVSTKNEGLSVHETWYNITNHINNTDIITSFNTLDPNGVVEIGFDQENSMNVIAAAAFAGLAGLASVGVATELKDLLTNSALAPVFQQVAVSLGTTTAAVITGYVSAIVAAYTNGWITNSQLFSLSQHMAWIQQGYKTMAIAIASGAAITGVGGLLGYLGVSTDVISTAIMAAGGATAGAGVALAMASSMSHVVRHSYWGE